MACGPWWEPEAVGTRGNGGSIEERNRRPCNLGFGCSRCPPFFGGWCRRCIDEKGGGGGGGVLRKRAERRKEACVRKIRGVKVGSAATRATTVGVDVLWSTGRTSFPCHGHPHARAVGERTSSGCINVSGFEGSVGGAGRNILRMGCEIERKKKIMLCVCLCILGFCPRSQAEQARFA